MAKMQQKKDGLKIYETELKLSELQIYLIARALDETITKFFKNPANRAACEEWKSKQGG